MAKDGTVWREEQLGTRLHFTPIEPYATDGEPTAKARRSCWSRRQSFLCIVTPDMLRNIQEWTIQHARQTEQVDWFMAIPELMAFIAVLILRGVMKLPSLRDSWSTKMGNSRIIEIMSRNRYQDIMRDLRHALVTGSRAVSERRPTGLPQFPLCGNRLSPTASNPTTLVDTSSLMNSFTHRRLAAVSCSTLQQNLTSLASSFGWLVT